MDGKTEGFHCVATVIPFGYREREKRLSNQL